MDAKAFDIYGPAIIQGALSARPDVISSNNPGIRASFIDGCVNLLEDVLARRDQLANSSAANPPTTPSP